jgi:hypothetical protein
MLGRILDFSLLCAVGLGLFAVALWLWPYLGPVGIAVAIILAIIPGNVLYSRASRRSRSTGAASSARG